MSLFKSTGDALRSSLCRRNDSLGALMINLTQSRNATKRVSGSRTNKNDSAGRRLGPKVHESHFVKPGQIIMRQRGTKLHPGENTGIGKDHTIFALEPGYVRFYYDPFHPLRKYVGVALKKDLTLPSPHFSPRIRRFGYVEIEDPEEALKEESHMSRKEYLMQPEIQKAQQRALEKDQQLSAKYKTQLPEYIQLGESSDVDLAVEQLLDVYKLTKVGQSVEEAHLQSTFNYAYNVDLKVQRGEISVEDAKQLKKHFTDVSQQVLSSVSVDHNGNLCKYLTPEQRAEQREQILGDLSKYKDTLITEDIKATITELISRPLVFSKSEQAALFKQYLPSVLPETISETVVEQLPKKVPKDMVIVRKFDNLTKQVRVFGRTKQAFLH